MEGWDGSRSEVEAKRFAGRAIRLRRPPGAEALIGGIRSRLGHSRVVNERQDMELPAVPDSRPCSKRRPTVHRRIGMRIVHR